MVTVAAEAASFAANTSATVVYCAGSLGAGLASAGARWTGRGPDDTCGEIISVTVGGNGAAGAGRGARRTIERIGVGVTGTGAAPATGLGPRCTIEGTGMGATGCGAALETCRAAAMPAPASGAAGWVWLPGTAASGGGDGADAGDFGAADRAVTCRPAGRDGETAVVSSRTSCSV